MDNFKKYPLMNCEKWLNSSLNLFRQLEKQIRRDLCLLEEDQVRIEYGGGNKFSIGILDSSENSGMVFFNWRVDQSMLGVIKRVDGLSHLVGRALSRTDRELAVYYARMLDSSDRNVGE